jgi:hypothetical protein
MKNLIISPLLFLALEMPAQQVTWSTILVNHQNQNCYKSNLISFEIGKEGDLFFTGSYKRKAPDLADTIFSFNGKINSLGLVNWVKPYQPNEFHSGWDVSDNAMFSGGRFTKYDYSGAITLTAPIGITDLFNDGNYIYAASNSSVFKTDLSGNIIWSQPFNNSSNIEVRPGDPGFFYLKTGDGSVQISEIKRIDSNGSIIWNKQLPLGVVTDITTDEFGNCYVLKESVIIKINNKGQTVWTKTAAYKDPTAIFFSNSLNQLLLTEYNSQSYLSVLTKYETLSGNFVAAIPLHQELQKMNSQIGANSYVINCIRTIGQTIYIAGNATNETEYESFMARLDQVLTGVDTQKTKEVEMDVYPNPTAGNVCVNFGKETTYADISIFDATNRIIYSETLQSAKDNHYITLSDCEPGLYFMVIETGRSYSKKKFVVQ